MYISVKKEYKNINRSFCGAIPTSFKNVGSWLSVCTQYSYIWHQHSLRSGVFIFMEEKFLKLKRCVSRIDFLNLILPGKGNKDKYLEVIFGKDDAAKYNPFEISKKSGGKREIIAPIPELKKIQRHLSRFLTEYYEELYGDINFYSNGFLKDKSIITNAKKHRNKTFVLNTDLEDFFPTITFGRIRNFFIKNNKFELSNEISTLIAKIACYKGYLPQGSPCSPIISNFICQILDIRLGKLAQKNRCSYSRYADDITFSTNLKNFPKEIAFTNGDTVALGNELISVITRAGFKINFSKSRVYASNTRQEVTNLTVNRKINVSRKYFDNTKAMARNYYLNGCCKINGKSGSYKQILGRFNFINQVEKYNNKLFFKKNEKKLPNNVLSLKDQKHEVTGQSKSNSVPVNLNLNLNSPFHFDGNSSKGIKYKIGYEYLSARERAYSSFLYYSTFIINEKPLVLTEGKTDIVYLKSALKNLYRNYPELIKYDGKNFEYQISFYRISKLNRYMLNINPSGLGLFEVLNPLYIFPKKSLVSDNPVIILLDNEESENKPLCKFFGMVHSDELKNSVLTNQYIDLNDANLKEASILSNKSDLFSRLKKSKFFLQIVPKEEGNKDADIETLIDSAYLEEVKFSRKPIKGTEIGKERLSSRVAEDYKNINFNKFKPIFDNMVKIIKESEENLSQ